MQQFWLIELRVAGGGSTLYYTSPNHWHSCVDLATKFHDGLAAKIEADKLRIAGSQHEVIVVEHAWGP